MRITDEIHLHTAEQIETYVVEARKLADALELADADRATLLPKIVELLSAKQVNLEATAPTMMAIPQGPQRR